MLQIYTYAGMPPYSPDITPAVYAAGLLLRPVRESRISSVGYGHRDDVLTSLRVAA